MDAQTFRCTTCNGTFESQEKRPYCKYGCRLPIERVTRFGDYVTTERVAPAATQPDRKEPEKKTPANGKSGECPTCGEKFARLDMHTKHCKGRAKDEQEQKKEPAGNGTVPADSGTDREGLDRADSV